MALLLEVVGAGLSKVVVPLLIEPFFGGLFLTLASDTCFAVVEGGEDFAVNLPNEVVIPFVEATYNLQRAEHELLEWGELNLLDKETLAEICAARGCGIAWGVADEF